MVEIVVCEREGVKELRGVSGMGKMGDWYVSALAASAGEGFGAVLMCILNTI